MNKEIDVRVRFFSEDNGGRSVTKDLLSGGTYMPHLVVGNPKQREVLVDDNNMCIEKYLGICFVSQASPLEPEKEIDATVITMYPDVDYSALIKGATFTIREGGNIVGNGIVL